MTEHPPDDPTADESMTDSEVSRSGSDQVGAERDESDAGSGRAQSTGAAVDPGRITRTARQGPLALVKHLRGSGLTVIDARTHETLARLGEGRQPHALAVHPSGRWGYVPYMGSNTLEVLDLWELEVVKRYEQVGTAPVGAALTRTGKYLFVSSYGGLPDSDEAGLTVFETAADGGLTPVSQQPLGKAAGISVDVRNDVWVALKEAGSVHTLSGEPPFEQGAQFDIPGQPQDVVYAAEYGLLGVNDVGDDSVTFVDTLAGEVRARVPAPNPRGGTPVPAADRWFVGDTEGDGVSAIDLAAVRAADGHRLTGVTDRVTLGTPTAFTDATPDGRLLAVDAYEDDRVSFLDPASLEVVARVETGGEPHHPRFSADGAVCYVPSVADDSVSVLETTSLGREDAPNTPATTITLPEDSAPSGCFRTDRRSL